MYYLLGYQDKSIPIKMFSTKMVDSRTLSSLQIEAKENSILSSRHVSLTANELHIITNLINTVNNPVIRKRDFRLNNPIPRYTILKASNNAIYLLGDGKRENIANAYLGDGAFGRVKGACRFFSDNNTYKFHNNEYAVKIFYREYISSSLFSEKVKNECNYFKMVYGYAELVKSNDNKHIYLIMPKLPGMSLNQINFENFTFTEILKILLACTKELMRIHEIGIIQGDIKGDNILYDHESQKAFAIDFNESSDIGQESYREYDRLLRIFTNDPRVNIPHKIKTELSALNNYYGQDLIMQLEMLLHYQNSISIKLNT